MGRKVKQLKNYTTSDIEAIIACDEKHNVGIKLHAIKQLSKGSSSRYLVDFYGTSFKQICNWADRFDKEGVAGLRLKPGRGRRCRLSEEQQYQIQGVLLKSPEEFGYNTANWTGALLGEHIFKTYRVEYKLAATYNLMKKLGFSYQRAKAFYPERDEVKRAQVKAEIKKT
jgi:transposase